MELRKHFHRPRLKAVLEISVRYSRELLAFIELLQAYGEVYGPTLILELHFNQVEVWKGNQLGDPCSNTAKK